jgi:uncharacterized protein YbjT (DUF2867 family)
VQSVFEQEDMMLLITGAAGASDRLIVNALSRRGQAVRALNRNPEKSELFRNMPGVEVMAADMGRPETLCPALEGADAAIVISSADERILETQCTFVDAALTQRAAGGEVFRPGVRDRFRCEGIPVHQDAR